MTARAPEGTRFGVGTTVNDAAPCTTTVIKPGDRTTFRVVCPAAPKTSKLVATIPMGDFEASFVKPL